MRTFSSPLSEDDLDYLRARHPESYVQRQIDLLGLEGSDQDDAKAAAEAAEAKAKAEADEAEAKAKAEADEAEAKAKAEADEAEAKAKAKAEAEDLIGDGDDGEGEFDVIGSTETEVKAWSEGATADQKASALATEQAREDREPRKGVVALLS